MRRVRGQEMVEFVIIFALIAISGVIVLTMLGNNIKDMFGLSHDKYTKFKPFGDYQNATLPVQTPPVQNPTKLPAEAPKSTVDVNGISVNVYNDGSMGFTSNGQQVYLDKTTIDNINISMETAGSNGGEKIIAMIDEMITSHKAEYPDTEVPLNMYFGLGNRTGPKDEMTYGNASMNLVMVQVGQDFQIMQKDQTGTDVANNSPQREFNIRGNTQNSNATFKGSKPDNFSELTGINTLQSSNGKFYVIGASSDSGGGGSGRDNSWTSTGMSMPPEWQVKDKNPPYTYFDEGKNWGLRDKAWMFEFDISKQKSLN